MTRNHTEAKPQYGRLTPLMAWQLAAPHTWPAAILPVLVAACATAVNVGSLSVTMTMVLLVICVLMQSSVNTFNDYFDYVKGSDSADDDVEESDAVLVYNNINPKHALALAIADLAVAFLFGLYVISQAGAVPLIIAIIGAVIVVLYSGTKTPISYMPIGELVSGVVMGGLITIACYFVLAGQFSLWVVFWSLPTIIGIGLIMFTNNTCDIEKDIPAGRQTLSIQLGREAARELYHRMVYVWIGCITIIVAIWFRGGLILLPFMLLTAYPLLKALFNNPLLPQTRVGGMAQILSVNIALNVFYTAMISISPTLSLLI